MIEIYYGFLKKKRDPLVERYFKENLALYIKQLYKKKNYDKILRFWIMIKSRKSFLSGPNLIKLGDVLTEMELYLNAGEVYDHLLKYRMFSTYWPEAKKQKVRLAYFMNQYEEMLAKLVKIKELKPGREADEFAYYRMKAHQKLGNTAKVDGGMGEISGDTIGNSFKFKLVQAKTRWLEESKKFKEALALCRKLLAYKGLKESRQIELKLKMADLQFINNEFKIALDLYLEVEKRVNKKNREWVLFQKINIYKKTDRAAEAAAEMQKLKKLNPDSFWIKQAEKDV